MFLPVSKAEMKTIGWDYLDVILVSGDAYIDSPFSGVAVIGKYLVSKGFKVGVIPQPRIDCPDDISALGEPILFWGVSAGCVDSMVANYTALGKPRKSCDFTPGGVNNRRPDRASIVYTGLIRRFFKNTKPIILGGIEASLRRVAHYDSKTDKIRRSILMDAKADAIIYGMGELAVFQLAKFIKEDRDWHNIKGVCYISKTPPDEGLELPSFEEAEADKKIFWRMFKTFYDNCDPITAKTLFQKTGDRYIIQNPPSFISEADLDEIGLLDFEREVHPLIKGEVRAAETIRFSIPIHRGCFGGCTFCAIAVHQGRHVVSRSLDSVTKEVATISTKKNFKGIISDMGGATANMYGMTCRKMETKGVCSHRECLFPTLCGNMDVSHRPILELLDKVTRMKGIKKVFASSGIRADLTMADGKHGLEYIKTLSERHVSGQLKLAPETGDDRVLKAMGKPSNDSFLKFLKHYKEFSAKAGKNQYISCYFIAAHPACGDEATWETRKFIEKYLDFIPEQVQIFTPTPSTWATCMYWTGVDLNGNEIFSEKNPSRKEKQKEIMMKKSR